MLTFGECWHKPINRNARRRDEFGERKGGLPLCRLHDRTLHSQFSASLQNLQQVRAGEDAFQVAVGHNR